MSVGELTLDIAAAAAAAADDDDDELDGGGGGEDRSELGTGRWQHGYLLKTSTSSLLAKALRSDMSSCRTRLRSPELKVMSFAKPRVA